MEAVWMAGGSIQAYDPEARDECRRLYGDRQGLILAEHRMEALDGADALVICTEWKEFRVADFKAIKAALRTPVIVDGRNIYEPSTVNAAGLLYFGVGRGDGVTNQSPH